MSNPEITILILSLSQSTDSFKELVSTLLLNLFKVRPHTGSLATYQLSRRLNMISIPTRLTWDELTRKFGLLHPLMAEKNLNNSFLKTKANYPKFQRPTTNRCWFELVWLQIQTKTQRKVWKKTSFLRAPRHPSRSDEKRWGSLCYMYRTSYKRLEKKKNMSNILGFKYDWIH